MTKLENIPPVGDKHRSPLRCIRAHCIECSGGSKAEVKYCTFTDCALYNFRFGKTPYHKNSKLKSELVS